MFEELLGYASVILIIASAVFAWKIFWATQSKSILWLFWAFIYLVVVRFLIVWVDPPYRNLMLLPFYIILTIAMWSFSEIIRKYVTPTKGSLWKQFWEWFWRK